MPSSKGRGPRRPPRKSPLHLRCRYVESELALVHQVVKWKRCRQKAEDHGDHRESRLSIRRRQRGSGQRSARPLVAGDQRGPAAPASIRDRVCLLHSAVHSFTAQVPSAAAVCLW